MQGMYVSLRDISGFSFFLIRMSSTILDKTKKSASPGLVLDWEGKISFSHY